MRGCSNYKIVYQDIKDRLQKSTDTARLNEIRFLLSAIKRLNSARISHRTKQGGRSLVRSWLNKADWKARPDLPSGRKRRNRSKSKKTPPPPPAPTPFDQTQDKPAPVIPAPPRPPFRERLWRTILSERTLQALLFLGIFLLFVAAISFVVWGWEDFPAPVRVAIPFGFTALFFILGQVVRARTHLDRSALALSAIAALLIPIDSYTIYANYGSPPQGWPEFWLITSLACLIAYIIAALYIQSRFFSYITGLAAGSTLLAIIEVTTDISRDWYSAAISVLAVGMIVLGTRLSRLSQAGRWRVFADPFRYLALWIPAAAMPLTLGLRLVTRDSFRCPALRNERQLAPRRIHLRLGSGPSSQQKSWNTCRDCIAGFRLHGTGRGLLPHRHQSRLARLRAGMFDSAVCVYGLQTFRIYKADEVLLSHGRTATRWGTALIIVAALLSLTDLRSGAPAAASHGYWWSAPPSPPSSGEDLARCTRHPSSPSPPPPSR
jgi:hypothetical protein